MWQLVLMAGAAGYYWAWQPLMDSELVQGVSCSVRGGVRVEFGPEDKSYQAMLAQDPYNMTRRDFGQVKGCMPSAGCAADPFEAERLLTRQIYIWKAKAVAYRTKSLVVKHMNNGKGLDVPGIAPSEEGLALAQGKEAQFCADYLTVVRARLPLPGHPDGVVSGTATAH